MTLNTQTKLERAIYYLKIITVCSYISACATSDYHSGHRVGAICADGWRSSATGRGACSHHGGVSKWLYSDGDGPVAFLSMPLYITGNTSLCILVILYIVLYKKKKKNL
jgi:hypothetical protein